MYEYVAIFLCTGLIYLSLIEIISSSSSSTQEEAAQEQLDIPGVHRAGLDILGGMCGRPEN